MFDAPDRSGARGAIGVAALVREVAQWLATSYSVCTVRGELSGYSRAASGHCYFNLKDADGETALLRCAMFRRAAGLLAFAPADGQLVEVRCRLGVYEPRGELQLVVESMQRAGDGALYERFLATKARLEALGLFDAARKRPLAAYPRSIGVVTSLGAAALHDVLTALARRAPHLNVVVYPSLVQGADAPVSIAQAIGAASARREVDTLIVCRGGGSLEDLWSFNDERVVRAIVAASMPIVCGVGHETDVTLADFAADLRAPTPTAAAELVAPSRAACQSALEAGDAVLRRRVHELLDAQAQRLDRAAMRLSRPERSVQQQVRQLMLLAHRLAGHMPREIAAQRERLAGVERDLRHRLAIRTAAEAAHLAATDARLRGLDPRRVLARGYAWLTDAAGAAVTSVERLTVGDRALAVLHDGTADVRVTALRRRIAG